MIITLTGKPCCGKSTTAEFLVEKYGFDRVYAGAIFKEEAKKMGVDILSLCSSEKMIEMDYAVDNKLKEIYNERLADKLLIESRTAWSFMPKAFNVYIDVDENTMAQRLFNSDRTGKEKPQSLEQAKFMALERYKIDCERYKKIYNIDCDNLKNYDLVINNSNLTPEQTAEKIYAEYLKYSNNETL